MAKTESQFIETKEILEKKMALLLKYLETNDLPEADRIRVSRVLNVIERYSPKRNLSEGDSFWKSYLQTAFRFLPLVKKGEAKPIELPKTNLSEHSRLLAEESIRILRDLRRIDKEIGETDIDEDEILDQEISGKVMHQEVIETSVTLDYERRNWGVERICLDGIQNHLPQDSKGTKVWVQCLVDDEWISIDEAKSKRRKIRQVRFVDDGAGFDEKNLSLFYSTKSDEKESAGQFGEGMKMIAAASLREGLKPLIESQNWQAAPTAKSVSIEDTRNKTTKRTSQLTYNFKRFDGPSIVGSRTIFRDVTEEFIDEVLELPNKVLYLREGYQPRFEFGDGEIVDTKGGQFFVKGIKVQDVNSIFTYNFQTDAINRDRNSVSTEKVVNSIYQILVNLNNVGLIKTYIQKAIVNRNAFEVIKFNGFNPKFPSIWKQAFHELYGKDAVLDTGYKPPEKITIPDQNKVTVPRQVLTILYNSGVKYEHEALPEYFEERLDTSITIDTGKEMWDEERILLDAIQNHLPSDSGGSRIDLHFQTADGRWYGFDRINDFKENEIKSIKISDNGNGYDYRKLGYIYSEKDKEDATGRFGEGMKMLSIASIRRGIGVHFQSRNWYADAQTVDVEIEGKQVKALSYNVKNRTKESVDFDGYSDYYNRERLSATTFTEITSELIAEFKKLPSKVLSVERKPFIDEAAEVQLLNLGKGLLFVKDIMIPGEHELMFSYNFKKFQLKNRDRNIISPEELTKEISQYWSETTSSVAIKEFMLQANLAAQKGKLMNEFRMNFKPKNPEQWRKIFVEVFGDNVSIRPSSSQDFDDFHQNMHLGLELISFPDQTFISLQSLGLPTYTERVKEMTDVEKISNEELTESEVQILTLLKELDKFLPGNKDHGLIVYTPKYEEQKTALGFADGTDIYLRRDILSDLYKAADVYIHEMTHHNTKSKDAEPEFRNYLTLALSKLLISQMQKKTE